MSESQPSEVRSARSQASPLTSTNYSATTTCGSSLDVGASCTVSVIFSPTATGSLPGTVVIGDNAANSPQTGALSGTGVAAVQGELTIAATPSSATVTSGGSAQFNLTVGTSGGPYNKAITLSASGLPSGATASFSPASVTPGSGTATSVLTIQTTGSNAANRSPKPLWPMGSPALALLLFAIPKRLRRQWSRRAQIAFLVLTSLAAAAAVTGCGGGFALPHTSVTSTITITATSGSDVHTTTVQLTVN
jgi:trimeric autotransporter adhesin